MTTSDRRRGVWSAQQKSAVDPAVVLVGAAHAEPFAFLLDDLHAMAAQLLRDHRARHLRLGVHRCDRRANDRVVRDAWPGVDRLRLDAHFAGCGAAPDWR